MTVKELSAHETFDQLRARVQQLSAPIDAGRLLDGQADAAGIVEVWLATQAHQNVADHLAWAVLLEAIRIEMSRRPRGLGEELRKRGMHLGRTEAEVNLQLGSRLYHYGWNRLATDENDGRAALVGSIGAFDRAESLQARLPQRARLGLLGMRGAARVALARRDDERGEEIARAANDLREAEELGDTSCAHFAFLAEAEIELARLGSAPASRAGDTLARASAHGCKTRELELLNAEAAGRRGFELVEAERPGEARQFFQTAVAQCELARELPSPPGPSDSLITSRRGRWLLQVAFLQSDLPMRQRMLEEAIGDLRVGGAGGSSLPRGLIALAEIAREDSDWKLVSELLSEASGVVASGREVDARLRVHLERMLLEAEVWAALDSESAADAVPAIEQMVDPESGSVSLAALSHGLKEIATLIPEDRLHSYCARAAEIARSESQDPALSRATRAFAASHGANLIWRVGRMRDADGATTAADFYREAIELHEEPPAELLSNAGECFLAVARSLGRSAAAQAAEAAFVLDDAVDCLSRALNAPVHTVPYGVVRSMLGDALSRRYVWSRDPADADAAILQLTEARDDADTRRVDDLLGNVYYRRGRRLGSADDLRKAIEFKEAAHDAGGQARENRSLCAAAHLCLYELEREPSQLESAVKLAAQAVELDRSWPWAWLQLSSIAGRLQRLGLAIPAQEPGSPLQLAAEGRTGELTDLACAAAAHTSEFERHRLGGRTGVFVIDDPHDLLAQTLVLKPTTRDLAERERQRTKQFSSYVRTHGDERMVLPEPLSIISGDDGSAVYVMQRARGMPLSALIAQANEGRRAAPIEAARRAARMLALYQASQSTAPVAMWSGGDRRRFTKAYGDALESLGCEPEAMANARVAFKELLGPLPLLAKKDAHPENWIVDEQGRVVMIDLEASSSVPVLLELVLLIDDAPLLDLSDDGFRKRLDIAQMYLDELRQSASHLPLDINVADLYEMFALYVAARGMLQSRSSRRRAHSSFLRRAVDNRAEHLASLCRAIAGRQSTAARAAALACDALDTAQERTHHKAP